MNKIPNRLTNESGSVLVIALLMLVFLTLLGIASTTTTSIELQIAQNERVYQNHFNAAEAAALHAVQWMDNADSNTLKDYDNVDFLNNYLDSPWNSDDEAARDFFRDPGNWDWGAGSPNAAALPVEDGSGNNAYPNAYFSILYAGDSSDCSMNADGSITCAQIYHCFGLYHLDTPGSSDRGEVVIEIGYKRWVNL